jgi:hypothetical protein
LNAAFAGSVMIEPVLWEERFYSAHDGFQPQIARSADCDIVIAALAQQHHLDVLTLLGGYFPSQRCFQPPDLAFGALIICSLRIR